MSPVLALAAASLVGWSAYRLGALTRSGALGAVLVGTASFSAGIAWGAYVLIWFGVTTAASRVGRQRKSRRSGTIVAKSDRRDLWQVLANGGVFAVAAIGAHVGPEWPFAVVGTAALAAAGADTLATECGILWGGRPWSLRTGRRVTPGTSGAVSAAGLLALLAGAALFAGLGWWLGLIEGEALVIVATAATIGAMMDTALGARWQARRWCTACETETEQVVHVCGTRSQPHGGLAWLDNDLVNGVCTITAALAAGALLTR